jgi:hypothetical protein
MRLMGRAAAHNEIRAMLGADPPPGGNGVQGPGHFTLVIYDHITGPHQGPKSSAEPANLFLPY